VRDFIVLLAVLALLPTSFRRPYIGLLLFSWLAYMRPQDLCWGFARTMRLSFLVGITMIAGWWAHERGRRRFTQWDGRAIMMLVLTLLVSLSYGFAEYHTPLFDRYFTEYLKIILVALFTIGQVDTRERFRWLAWTIALSLGFYGFKGGVFGILSGGSQILRGPGGMLEDNNDFALALVMNVPLLYYMGLSERATRFVRTGSLVVVFFTAIAVVLTHSRGAFLALSCTALWISWRSGKLFRAALALCVIAVSFLAWAPQSVLSRLGTIGTEEGSAQARLTAWGVALRMIEDNPVLGVGMRNFQPRYLEYAEVKPDARVTTYVSHNSYLQIWAESGTIAFAVYLCLLASVFVTCRRVYLMGMLRPDMAYARDYARMLEATTIGFAVGAFFLNRGHFDLIYHWFALVSALGLIASAAYVATPRATGREAGTEGVRVRMRPAWAGGAIWGRLR
jgi:probable O-glycosylation ligase (exosortase A-associated)